MCSKRPPPESIAGFCGHHNTKRKLPPHMHPSGCSAPQFSTDSVTMPQAVSSGADGNFVL